MDLLSNLGLQTFFYLRAIGMVVLLERLRLLVGVWSASWIAPLADGRFPW